MLDLTSQVEVFGQVVKGDDRQPILADLGMTVREGDLVRPALDAPVTAGTVIRLAKARTVNVRVDGKDQLLYTHATTVADVLTVLGIELGPEDSVEPAAESYLQNGMSIAIALTRQVIEEVSEPISPPTVYETDSTLATGTVKVVKGGLDVVDEETGDVTVIASAAVAVRAEIPKRAS